MFFLITKFIVLLTLLISTSIYSAPLGGLIWARISILTFFGKNNISKLFRLFFYDYTKLIILFKLFSWFISSCGSLLGLLIFNFIYKYPMNKCELYLILLISLSSILNISANFITFDIITYNELLPNTKKYFKKKSYKEIFDFMKDKKTKQSISRSVFADLFITQLFRLFFSIALVYFSLAHLGYLQFVTNTTTCTITECIQIAFTNIQPLATNSITIFKGQVWTVCNFSASFLVFLWVVFFVSSAQSMFLDEN